MRAVMRGGPELEALIRERRRKGLDLFDEVWEGVLHMTPAPSPEHQRIVSELHVALHALAQQGGRGRVFLAVNLVDPARELDDYRIPDLSFVCRENLGIVEDAFLRGGADVVIEIESPDDETRDKLPFYGRIGVREAILIDRDTKAIERFANEGGELKKREASPAAVLSEILGLTFERIETAEGARLRVSGPGRSWEF